MLRGIQVLEIGESPHELNELGPQDKSIVIIASNGLFLDNHLTQVESLNYFCISKSRYDLMQQLHYLIDRWVLGSDENLYSVSLLSKAF